MNQALKYEELEKIFFTKAPITDASIWLLKLDPDCQNNPVEKALLDEAITCLYDFLFGTDEKNG